MAIYKPSNCVPFLTSLDLTQNQDLSFQINTNNIDVTGYKLKILDSENNEVFYGKKFSPLTSYSKYLNNTTNGSVVRLPFIRRIDTFKDWQEIVFELGDILNNIVIYCNYPLAIPGLPTLEKNKFYSLKYSIVASEPIEFEEIPKLKNEYSYQPYKWQVVLAQGQEIQYHNSLPYVSKYPIDNQADNKTGNKFYDMLVASGKIIGSTPNRLQGILSEKIFKDYFVQLYNENKKEISSRVLINSYDHTYGYIYPQENVFTTENIAEAKYFKIFKNTNNIEYITNPNRIVDCATSSAMGNVLYSSKYNSSTFNNLTSWVPDKSGYFDQTYSVTKKDVGIEEGSTALSAEIPIPANMFDNAAANGVNLQPGGSLLLVKNENNNDTSSIPPTSPYNGVFLFVSAIWKQNSDTIIGPKLFDGTVNINTKQQAGGKTYYTGTLSPSFILGIPGYKCEVSINETTYTLDVATTEEDGNVAGSLNFSNGTVYIQTKNNVTTIGIQSESPLTNAKVVVKNNPSGVLTIRWQRAASADTWAEFIGQSFYVKTNATNWDSNAQASGTLNSTFLGFVREKPIEIYPNLDGENKSLGVLLKTNELIGKDKKTVYIRPSSSDIRTDNQFKYVLKDGETGILNVVDADTETWCVLVKTEETTPNFQPDQDSYYINSYFKISDENPFYAYNSPTVKIIDVNNVKTEELSSLVVYDRILKVKGKYDQSVNRMWKSFYWTLTDLSLNQTTTTKVSYSGSISAEFIGIEKDKRYIVSLIVEDEFGNVYTDKIYLTTQIETIGNVFASDFTSNIDCQTQSAEFNFYATSKVIPDDNDKGDINYSTNGEATIKESCELIKNTESNYYYPLGYTQTFFSNKNGENNDNSEFAFYGDVPAPTEDYFTINSCHSNLNEYFQGYLLGYQIGSNEFIGDYFFFLDTNTDNFKDDFGMVRVNPDRNKLTARVFLGDNEVKSSIITTLIKNNENWIDNKGCWRKQKPVIFSLQKPNYVSENENIIGKYDYIFSDYYYDNESGTNENVLYLVNGKGTDCGTKGTFKGSPCDATTVTSGTNGFWSDMTIKKMTQIDKSCIGVLNKGVNNKLPENEAELRWNDTGDYGCYVSKDVNAEKNHSGRQDFSGKKFTFNVVFGNYNINRQNQEDVEIKSKCYIEEVNNG